MIERCTETPQKPKCSVGVVGTNSSRAAAAVTRAVAAAAQQAASTSASSALSSQGLEDIGTAATTAANQAAAGVCVQAQYRCVLADWSQRTNILHCSPTSTCGASCPTNEVLIQLIQRNSRKPALRRQPDRCGGCSCSIIADSAGAVCRRCGGVKRISSCSSCQRRSRSCCHHRRQCSPQYRGCCRCPVSKL